MTVDYDTRDGPTRRADLFKEIRTECAYIENLLLNQYDTVDEVPFSESLPFGVLAELLNQLEESY